MEPETVDQAKALKKAVSEFMRSHIVEPLKPGPVDDYPELQEAHLEPLRAIIQLMRTIDGWAKDFHTPIPAEVGARYKTAAGEMEKLSGSLNAIDSTFDIASIVKAFSETVTPMIKLWGDPYTPHLTLPRTVELLETGRQIITEVQTQYPQLLQASDDLQMATTVRYGHFRGKAKDFAAALEGVTYLSPLAINVQTAAAALKKSLGLTDVAEVVSVNTADKYVVVAGGSEKEDSQILADGIKQFAGVGKTIGIQDYDYVTRLVQRLPHVKYPDLIVIIDEGLSEILIQQADNLAKAAREQGLPVIMFNSRNAAAKLEFQKLGVRNEGAENIKRADLVGKIVKEAFAQQGRDSPNRQ